MAPNLPSQMPSFNNPAQLSIFRDSEAQMLRERAAAIVWVKSRMAKHGITEENLVSAGCFGDTSVGAIVEMRVQYRDADGHSWNGEGALPEWLQRAVNAGQSVEHFRVA
jgi:DNA-binding protein H-NS